MSGRETDMARTLKLAAVGLLLGVGLLFVGLLLVGLLAMRTLLALLALTGLVLSLLAFA